MNNLWPFLTIIIVVGIVFDHLKSRHKHQLKLHANTKKMDEFQNSLEERLQRMEERLANLETIVLEQEKHSKFDRALHED